jgi:DNA-binding Lrp family transcriptional regulator
VRALHEALTAFDQGAAHALEVNRSDLQALLMLEHGPRPARDLSRALGLSSGATTALVDRLERAGLVQRSASESDRRVTLVGLSAPAFRRIGGLYAGLFRAFVGSVETAPAHHLEAATQVLRTLALTCQEAAALAREGR